MAPLLDNNHELSWQVNMVDAIEQKAASQRTEGQPAHPSKHMTASAAPCCQTSSLFAGAGMHCLCAKHAYHALACRR